MGRSPKVGNVVKRVISAGRANSITELRYIEKIASDLFSKDLSSISDDSAPNRAEVLDTSPVPAMKYRKGGTALGLMLSDDLGTESIFTKMADTRPHTAMRPKSFMLSNDLKHTQSSRSILMNRLSNLKRDMMAQSSPDLCIEENCFTPYSGMSRQPTNFTRNRRSSSLFDREPKLVQNMRKTHKKSLSQHTGFM